MAASKSHKGKKIDEKTLYYGLMIAGLVLAMQHILLTSLGIIHETAEWSWQYDLSGMLVLLGIGIGVYGLFMYLKTRK